MTLFQRTIRPRTSFSTVLQGLAEQPFRIEYLIRYSATHGFSLSNREPFCGPPDNPPAFC